jgi:formylglycine-generating enzyme required for sulfatase activity
MGLVDTGSAHDASTNPAVGIFIYRTNDGFGTVTANGLRLQWSYADNGASSGDVVEIRVMALEMVYIPEGAFYAGDNAMSTAAFRQKSTGDNDPWYISSENPITTTGTTTGDYYYPGGNGYGDAANSIFTIPTAFPKGYGALYMAKGEISQITWVVFFNMLTNDQKDTRDVTSVSGKNSDGLVLRNNVSWISGEATLPDNGGGATYSGVAMNWISWADLAAFLDWAGLRPMSELEYEKAARGTKPAVSGEYAWGSTSITQATSISNAGLPNERGQPGSNAAYGYAAAVTGPLRIGSFASGVSSRVASGGSYYGVMELSGNLHELPVTVGRETGRSFEGRYHGNGVLDALGEPNVTSWPGTDADGVGWRGGSFADMAVRASISSRRDAARTISVRGDDLGGRGVRSAP